MGPLTVVPLPDPQLVLLPLLVKLLFMAQALLTRPDHRQLAPQLDNPQGVLGLNQTGLNCKGNLNSSNRMHIRRFWAISPKPYCPKSQDALGHLSIVLHKCTDGPEHVEILGYEA